MFDKSNRTLMAMLFDRWTIKEMCSTINIYGFERHIRIRCFRAEMFRDEDYYMASISGWEDDFVGSTLDEVLDQLQAYINDCNAAHERIRRRRTTA